MPQRNITWKSIERSRRSHYRLAERQFYDALMEQLKPLIERAAAGNIVDAAAAEALMSEGPIREKMEFIYRQTGSDYAEKTAGQFGVKGLRDAYERFFENYVLQNCGEKITTITGVSKDYTKGIINKILAETNTLGEGDTARVIEKELRVAGAKISNWRSRVIARTEVAAASNVGQQVGAESVGQPMTKKWLSTMDDRVRDRHAEMNGKTAALDSTFQVGFDQMMTPGDPSASVENVVNCRCTCVYYVNE